MSISETTAALITAAAEARKNAHAPYSKYPVGAALLAADGRVFLGCNMENASYGLTICAERVAFGSAVAAGARRFTHIAIVADGPRPVPCGACLQVMSEFSPSLAIIIASPDSKTCSEYTLDKLMPEQFIFSGPDVD